MIRALTSLLSLALFAVLLAPSSVHAQEAAPEDVASPEAIVAATYESIQRAPGENYDWPRFRSLFIPEARLIPNKEQTGGQFRVLSPQDFIDWADSATTIGGPNDRGFSESEIHSKVERYGDIAHVFSTYQKHFWNDERVLGRGINTFQLVYHADRWWVVGIVWDEPTGAGPIPDQYLPQGE